MKYGVAAVAVGASGQRPPVHSAGDHYASCTVVGWLLFTRDCMFCVRSIYNHIDTRFEVCLSWPFLAAATVAVTSRVAPPPAPPVARCLWSGWHRPAPIFGPPDT